MSSLFGGSTPNTSAASISGMQIQSSVNGKPIPLAFGACKGAGNLVEYGDFVQVSGGGSGGKGGGKGGGGGSGGGKGGSSSADYNAAVDIALCEGPIAGIGQVWSNKSVNSAGGWGFDVFEGSYPQSPWGYTVQNPPQVSLAYAGVAHAASSALDLGSSGQLPNLNWELFGFFYGTAANGIDADASQVALALLVNAFWGPGFPAARVGQYEKLTETHTVPATGPFTVAVGASAGLILDYNLCVTYPGNPQPLACVAGSPAQGQYSVAFSGVSGAATYTFNAADAGNQVTIECSGNTGAFTLFQQWANASELWISPYYDTQQQASQMLQDIATNCYAEWVWTGSGVLTLVPRGAVAITGNGYAYTPPGATPLFNLADDDFLPNSNASTSSASMNDDPVICERSRTADQLNDIKLEFLDRTNYYAPSIAEATDQALIDNFGRRTNGSQTAHLFCDYNAANISAQLQLQDQYIRNSLFITLDERYSFLEPMDVVTVADATVFPDLPNNRDAARILEIVENDDGSLSIQAEEYPGVFGQAAEFTINVGEGFTPNYNAPAPSINPPVMWEPTFQLAGEEAIWMAFSGSGPNWGGNQVLASSDKVSYAPLPPFIAPPPAMGVLTAALPAVTPAATGPTIDTTSTLAVNVAESGQELISGSQTDMLAGNTLCYVDGEYIAFETATLGSAAGLYSLTTLNRGLFGSTVAAHAAGSNFVRLNGPIYALPFTPDRIGQKIWFKFPSFNPFGGGAQQQAEVPAYVYVVQGTALAQPLANVTGLSQAQGPNNMPVINWSAVTDAFRAIDYEIRGPGPSWQQSPVLGRTGALTFQVTSDGTFWVAAHYQTPQGLNVYSATPSSIPVTLPIPGWLAIGSLTAETGIGTGTIGTGWVANGTISGAAVIGGDLSLPGLEIAGGNNWLALTDFLNTADILFGGAVLTGEANAAVYELGVLPGGTYLTGGAVGFTAPALLLPVVSYTLYGESISGGATNFLGWQNLLAVTDVLGWALGENLEFLFQIHGHHGGGSPLDGYQSWVPGQTVAIGGGPYGPGGTPPFLGGAFSPVTTATLLISFWTDDPQTEALLEHLKITWYAWNNIQGQNNVAIPAAGASISFGSGYTVPPSVTATITDQQPGDVLVGPLLQQAFVSGFGGPTYWSGFTIQVQNGGVGVARTINWTSGNAY